MTMRSDQSGSSASAAGTRYSIDYFRDEAEARAAKPGIWSGDFVMSWAWPSGKH